MSVIHYNTHSQWMENSEKWKLSISKGEKCHRNTFWIFILIDTKSWHPSPPLITDSGNFPFGLSIHWIQKGVMLLDMFFKHLYWPLDVRDALFHRACIDPNVNEIIRIKFPKRTAKLLTENGRLIIKWTKFLVFSLKIHQLQSRSYWKWSIKPSFIETM